MNDKPSKWGQQVAKSQSPRQRLDLWHGGFFVLGVVLTVTLGLVLGHLKGRGSPRRQGSPNAAAANGPWGCLEYKTIELERPDESLQVNGTPDVPLPRWLFENIAETDLARLLTASDMTAEQTRQLTDRKIWTRDGTGWRLLPPPEVVLSLSSQCRQRIYAVLARSPRNALHFHPFQIATTKFDNWVKTSRLPEDKQTLLRTLAYENGSNTCLADFEIVESRCTLEERKRFAKSISRTEGLLMRLHVQPNSDVDALARYWSRGGRMKAMKPLLESLSHAPGGGVISVAYFFPEFARMRLYTYPDPQTDPTAQRQDCFWTAMNFLNEEPDNRFLQADTIRQVLQSDYAQVQTNWAFGDIIVVLENGQNATHMCVYIADDVVFTKNGVDPLEPWLLMKIPDMIRRYENGKPITLTAYRHKNH